MLFHVSPAPRADLLFSLVVSRYNELANRVDESLGFMAACGLTAEHPLMKGTEFFTSHECLLLPYEEALTRKDSTTGLWCDQGSKTSSLT